MYDWKVDQSVGLPGGGLEGCIWSEEERVSIGATENPGEWGRVDLSDNFEQ